ncbi:MAG TPA: hypothetical protein VGR62_15075 [Candidatus Binatia bacterium]|jgi:hypothetical protein|nr:hypothetical protein [Candidatus Binatia bacterium]
MRWLVTTMAVLLAGVPVRADYLSERRSQDSRIGAAQWADQMAVWNGRLYLARKAINDIQRGWTVRDIMKKYGDPDERRRTSDTEEVFVYRGRKTLYRGTIHDNVAVGPEWTEITFRDGVPTRRTEVLQVVEVNGGLATGPSCEYYGSRNADGCVGVERIDPVPAMPSPAPSTAFACSADGSPPPVGESPAPGVTSAALERIFADVVSASTHGEEPARVPHHPRERPTVVLGQVPPQPGDHEPGIAQANCAVSASLPLAAPNQRGALVATVCDRATELRWSEVCDARARPAEILFSMGTTPDAAFERLPVLRPGHRRTRSGPEAEYFTVVVVGHGMAFLPTVVVTSPSSRSAVVVQLQSDDLCDSREPLPGIACRDAQRTIVKIGLGLARRLLTDPNVAEGAARGRHG